VPSEWSLIPKVYRMLNMFALNAAREYDSDGQPLSRLDIRIGGTKLLRYIFTDAVK
jgi:hypothetical protein